MSDAFIWLDIETSGLDHTEDALLEIGAVLTGPDLQPIDEFHLADRLSATTRDELRRADSADRHTRSSRPKENAA